MEDSGAQVRVGGDVRGQVVVGDHNIVVSAERSVVTIVSPGQRPECRRRDELELLPRRMRKAVGRDEELAAITDAMGAGGPVQVHGPSGRGKSTLLRMAAHELSGRGDGVVFVDAASRNTSDVLQDVFEVCYDAPGYRPGDTELRRLMAGVRAFLVLDDLACDSQRLDALLDTLKDGRVLYSATERSLWGEGRALALRGLNPDAALALLTQQLGRPLRPDEQPVAEALVRVTEGSPRELLRAVAETRLRAPAELEHLLPNMLADLAGTDQELITLLGLAGAGGVSTGLLTELVPDAVPLDEVCERLEAAGLTVPTVTGYRIATEVVDALPERLRPDRSALAGLCGRLQSWVDGARSPAEVAADGALISAAIEAAAGAGAAAEGARLARAAAPAVACSLRLGVWGRILEQGRAAAERAREDGILAYLTHEDGIRHLVTGKRVTAAAAFATAAAIWQRLGESDHAGAAQDAGELCGPDAASPSEPGTQDGADSADPSASTEPPEASSAGQDGTSSAGQDGTSSAGQDAGASAGPGPDAAQDPTGGLASAPPVDPGTAAVGAKGIGLTAKLVIGGSLAAVVAGGLVFGHRATAPDTVPTRVTVTTSVVEVTMPGEQEDDCVIKGGETDCTTVVTSKKGTKGPLQVKLAAPLPDGVRIVYWGCEDGPEAKSCTVRADKSRTVCISTTSPDDAAARRECAEATGSRLPTVRTEQVTVVMVDAQGAPRPGYKVTDGGEVFDGCYASPAAVSEDIVSCGPSASNADVCWVEDSRLTALCGSLPWEKTLRRVTLSETILPEEPDPIPPTEPDPDPVPWVMELADGTRCRLRNGQTWGALPNDMVGAYWCLDSRIVIAEVPDKPLIDKSAPGWTVQVMDYAAVEKGDNTIPPRREVAKVYYAGRPERG